MIQPGPMRAVLWAFIAITVSACAGKKVAVSVPPVDLAPADALLRAGCYTCLQQAYQLYDQARTSPNAPARARDGAFVSAVFLALREKDLDLEATPWLARARDLATADEASY